MIIGIFFLYNFHMMVFISIYLFEITYLVITKIFICKIKKKLLSLPSKNSSEHSCASLKNFIIYNSQKICEF